jgi:uncharacterized protein (DUF849 family)
MLIDLFDREREIPPLFIRYVLGVVGGVAVETEQLLRMKPKADRPFGDDCRVCVAAACRMRTRRAAIGAAPRGSGAGRVSRMRAIVEAIGRRVAAAGAARAMLGLGRRGATAFAA